MTKVFEGKCGVVRIADDVIPVENWSVTFPQVFPRAEPGPRAKRNYARLSQQAANNNLDYSSNPFASWYNGYVQEASWEIKKTFTPEEIDRWNKEIQAFQEIENNNIDPDWLDRLPEVPEADGNPESDG